MTIERYFLDGYRDEALYEELKASDTFPLVRELEFKYGLKVFRKITARPVQVYENINAWMMCHKNGLAVGVAYTHNKGGKEADQLEYCFRTPYFSKERGRSAEDKETMRSAKLSALMAAIKRYNVIPTAEGLVEKKLGKFNSARAILHRGLGNNNKRNEFTAEEVQVLLANLLGRNTDSNFSGTFQNKCIEVLDKYEEADRLTKLKVDEANRLFTNPFYVVGVDEFKDFIVGAYKATDSTQENYEAVIPLMRYRTYQEVPDLIPIMTMIKLAYENAGESIVGGCVPLIDRYNESLDTVFFYDRSVDKYNHTFMVTPCPI